VGDANFGPSTSATLLQTVNPAATSTTLTSSQNPSNQGQPVTFTATVTPSGATGQVSFRNGATAIGSATLNANGMATLTTGSLPGGNHSITAVYAGDGNFLTSTSAAVAQVVNSISLMLAQNSATVSRRGGTATFMLTVGQAGALSAPINFSCSGLLSGWSCTFNPNSVPAGSGPTTVTLTIQAGSVTAQYLPQLPTSSDDLRGSWPAVLALLTLGIPWATRRRKDGRLRPAVALGLAALLLLAAGCGGSSRQPRVVNVTVTATSGSTTASSTVTITVQ
jgi:hypothetical protein